MNVPGLSKPTEPLKQDPIQLKKAIVSDISYTKITMNIKRKAALPAHVRPCGMCMGKFSTW